MTAARLRRAAAACALCFAASSPAWSAPEDPVKPAPPAAPGPAAPAAPAGPVYKNADMGVTVEGPAGWRLVESKGAPTAWSTIATFTDAASGSTAVLTVRRASAVTLSKLRAEVTGSYADDRSFTVNSITDLPVGGRRALPGVLVDAQQLRAADAPAPGSPTPAVPAPSVAWRVRAAYLLGGEWEYLLYVQTKATLWSRFEPIVDRLIDGVTTKPAATAFGPRGEGAFRDDTAGFACRFPTGFSVRLPERTLHLVEFAPASGGPLLGVFRYDSEGDLEHETKTLVDYYTGTEVGGEATSGRVEVAGREGALVTAKGRIGGRDQVFYVAVVKRGNDTFRLRVADDVAKEATAKAAFDAFVKSFTLTSGGGG